MKKLTLAAAMLTVASSGIAMAQMGPGDPWGDKTITRAEAEAGTAARFDKADTNHDGFLSPEELQASRPGGPGGPGGRERGGPGGRMDADGDGKITKQEYLAAQARRFDMLDANKDGQVTKAERDAMRDAMRARMQQRPSGGNWGGSSDDD